jgi:hypothetical protein
LKRCNMTSLRDTREGRTTATVTPQSAHPVEALGMGGRSGTRTTGALSEGSDQSDPQRLQRGKTEEERWEHDDNNHSQRAER